MMTNVWFCKAKWKFNTFYVRPRGMRKSLPVVHVQIVCADNVNHSFLLPIPSRYLWPKDSSPMETAPLRLAKPASVFSSVQSSCLSPHSVLRRSWDTRQSWIPMWNRNGITRNSSTCNLSDSDSLSMCAISPSLCVNHSINSFSISTHVEVKG